MSVIGKTSISKGILRYFAKFTGKYYFIKKQLYQKEALTNF